LASYAYAYDPGVRRTQETISNGTPTTCSYDAADQVTLVVQGASRTTYAFDFAGTCNNAGFVPGGAGQANELQADAVLLELPLIAAVG
jgi:uncharacterized protein RhaS with RHS repeats